MKLESIYRYYKAHIIVKVEEYRTKNNRKLYKIKSEYGDHIYFNNIGETKKRDLLENKGYKQFFSSHSSTDIELKNNVVCVVAKDTFLSNWGHDKNKTSLCLFPIKSCSEISVIEDNICNRTDMRYMGLVNSDQVFREYPKHRYHIGLLDRSSSPRFYQVNGFTRGD